MALQNDPPVNQTVNRMTVNWPAIGRGLLAALVIAIVLGLLSTLLLHFSSLSEKFLSWIAAFILIISAFFGSGLAAARAGNKGLFHGLGVGLGFFVLIWLLGTLLFPEPITLLDLLEKLLLTVSAGALGGILGVNLSEQSSVVGRQSSERNR
jgi:putative membrane protein (TIGR04086 family)